MRIVETNTKPASSSCFFTKNTRGVGPQSSFYLGWVFSLDTLFAAGNFFSLICGKPSVVPSPILYSQKWFASDALARREKGRERRLSPAANCRCSFVFALFFAGKSGAHPLLFLLFWMAEMEKKRIFRSSGEHLSRYLLLIPTCLLAPEAGKPLHNVMYFCRHPSIFRFSFKTGRD